MPVAKLTLRMVLLAVMRQTPRAIRPDQPAPYRPSKLLVDRGAQVAIFYQSSSLVWHISLLCLNLHGRHARAMSQPSGTNTDTFKRPSIDSPQLPCPAPLGFCVLEAIPSPSSRIADVCFPLSCGEGFRCASVQCVGGLPPDSQSVRAGIHPHNLKPGCFSCRVC